MLRSVQELNYVIVLCDDLDRMKAFYRDLFTFSVESESATGLTFRAGSVLLGLRKRTRDYDGRSAGIESPGVQIAFLVSPPEVDRCYDQLVDKDVEILDPPNDQPREHRTAYFSIPRVTSWRSTPRLHDEYQSTHSGSRRWRWCLWRVQQSGDAPCAKAFRGGS